MKLMDISKRGPKINQLNGCVKIYQGCEDWQKNIRQEYIRNSSLFIKNNKDFCWILDWLVKLLTIKLDDRKKIYKVASRYCCPNDFLQ